MKVVTCLLSFTLLGVVAGAATNQSTACNCGLENVPSSGRISGGSYASPNQYPWMVRLQGCGGTLISDRHILTAQHCVDHSQDWSTYRAKVSVHDQYDGYQLVKIKGVHFPPVEDSDHDIAILELTESVTFDSTIHPACLPKSGDFVWSGESAMAMGWGQTHHIDGQGGSSQSRTLKKVELTVERERGNYYFQTDVADINGVPQDPCAGDSGGPLLHQDPNSLRWMIIGTVWGGGYDCRTGNGREGSGAWAKVSGHLDWINSIIAGSLVCAPFEDPTEPPVNGDWTVWGTWSRCSVTCGGGVSERKRSCTNPAPSNGGSNCIGQSAETKDCNTSACPTRVYTLVGSDIPGMGNVLVDGRAICDDYWGHKDARVVCRSLGLGRALEATKYNRFNTTSNTDDDDFAMDNVGCVGTETSLDQCPHTADHNCKGREKAGVRCVVANLPRIKLKGGRWLKGNVKVNGRYVCDDDWDLLDAGVACRALGFSGATDYKTGNFFRTTGSRFEMTNVNCTGTEVSMFKCPHQTTSDCGVDKKAGVVCE